MTSNISGNTAWNKFECTPADGFFPQDHRNPLIRMVEPSLREGRLTRADKRRLTMLMVPDNRRQRPADQPTKPMRRVVTKESIVERTKRFPCFLERKMETHPTIAISTVLLFFPSISWPFFLGTVSVSPPISLSVCVCVLFMNPFFQPRFWTVGELPTVTTASGDRFR